MADNSQKGSRKGPSNMAPTRPHETPSRPAPDSTSSEAAPKPAQPHPSFIQVAKPYVFEQTIQECLSATGVDSLREDSIRIQGVTWIDNVRKALRLPVRTYNTACVYYHKFRLVHSDNQYNYMDAAAAALFTACKIEDTLKKSRDIVCAAYNLKLSASEHLAPDDPVFDSHSRGIIILERLMLEASGFDFRNRQPQKLLVKLAKRYHVGRDDEVGLVAYGISLDLYRTFAPLKQTTAAMAFACLELASRLIDAGLEEVESGRGYATWKIERGEVMETMLDLLDLYTHHRANTVIGTDFPLEAFLAVRIPLNQEADEHHLPRFFSSSSSKPINGASSFPSSGGGGGGGGKPHKPKGNKNKQDREAATTTNLANSTNNHAPHVRPSLLANPLTPSSANGEKPAPSDRGRDGTVRFMLDPTRAEAEKRAVSRYFRDEMEDVVVGD